jgi:hypothetical protein
MQRPPAPEVLTADDPIAAYESAVPLLLDILPDKSSSSCLVREIVWSIYNNHPVGLSRICTLDQYRKDAVLAVINLRMALGGNSDPIIRELLEESGELARSKEAQQQATTLNVRHSFYPGDRLDPSDYDQMSNAARALDKAENR